MTAITHPNKHLIAGLIALILSFTTATTTALAHPDSFADLAESISPVVVNITTTQTVTRGANRPNFPDFPEGSPFSDLFRDFFNQQNNGQQYERKIPSLGSGFVVSADGYIITNNHVINEADEIVVEFFDGEKRDAKLIGRDRNTDIALLKVEADSPLPFAQFGDSDESRVGDWVVAIGNPLGQGFTVTTGIISARNRSLQGGYDDFIQTDAAINRGNSGGPLFNLNGEVIGVNTAILSPNGGSVGLGFSMASNVVKKVRDQLQEFGETRRGWLGVQIQDLDEELAEALGLESTDGALISGLLEGPASIAGIQTGDVILAFDGTDVEDTRQLIRLVGNSPVDATVRVLIYRGGQTQTIKVTLTRREDFERASRAESEEPKELREDTILGMRLTVIDDQLRNDLQLDDEAQGLVILDISGTSEAFEKGVQRGDIIVMISDTAVKTIGDMTGAIDAIKETGRASAVVLFQRGSDSRYVGLSLE